MNQDPTCHELADRLSQNFRNVEPFSKSASLPSYLSTHGLLLSMCWPRLCTLPLGTSHLSGSWISETTGVQVIMGDVGMLLDPSKVNVRCLYPTDGKTDDRDGNGCGPVTSDPKYGSKGARSYNVWTKYLARKAVTDYKNLNFGIDTDWEDIDCDYFLANNFGGGGRGGGGGGSGGPPNMSRGGGPPGGGMSMVTWDWAPDVNAIEYYSQQQLQQEAYEALMGHPVCSMKTPDLSHASFLMFQGPFPWTPVDWQEVIDLQLDFLAGNDPNHTAASVWNEVVMDLPKPQLMDVVLGLFFLDSPDKNDFEREEIVEELRTVSSMMGGKPILSLQSEPLPNQDILQCVNVTRSAEEM